jgi:hypothetical protein
VIIVAVIWHVAAAVTAAAAAAVTVWQLHAQEEFPSSDCLWDQSIRLLPKEIECDGSWSLSDRLIRIGR